jgi:hypothetical protein
MEYEEQKKFWRGKLKTDEGKSQTFDRIEEEPTLKSQTQGKDKAQLMQASKASWWAFFLTAIVTFFRKLKFW